MNKKALRIVAGVLFLLQAVIPLIVFLLDYGQLYPGRIWWRYMEAGGFILIAISLFADFPILTVLGAIANIVYASFLMKAQFLSFLNLFSSRFLSRSYGKLALCYYVITIIAFLLLALGGITRRAAKPLGILSGALYAISIVFLSNIWSSSFSFRTIGLFGALYIVLFLIGAILLGIGFSEPKEQAMAATRSSAPSSAISTKLDQLTRLKSLLDMGALTQEEFEEKKRQILGQ